MTAHDREGGRRDSLPLGTALDLLADARRRDALYYLRDAADDPVGIDRLAERIAGRERGHSDDPSDSDGSSVRRVGVALRHVHLPKLNRAGVVEYDRRSETVSYRERALAEQLLDAAATLEASAAGR